MSVLIKNMRVPEDCFSCPLKEEGYCNLTNAYAVLINERDSDCPLVSVPESHGRLIDADAAMKQWGLDKATKYGNETSEQQHFSYSTMMMYEIVDILDDAPVVIEAEGEG
jgi:hypothetical protein